MTHAHRVRSARHAAVLLVMAGILLLAVTAQSDTRDDVLAFMDHYLDSFDNQPSRYTASLHHAPMYVLAPHGVLTVFETLRQDSPHRAPLAPPPEFQRLRPYRMAVGARSANER